MYGGSLHDSPKYRSYYPEYRQCRQYGNTVDSATTGDWVLAYWSSPETMKVDVATDDNGYWKVCAVIWVYRRSHFPDASAERSLANVSRDFANLFLM